MAVNNRLCSLIVAVPKLASLRKPLLSGFGDETSFIYHREVQH